MTKQEFPLTSVFVVALLVSGAVGIAAVVSNYSGNVDIKLGTEGIQFRVGGSSTPKISPSQP
jgi:hypothetical protein